MKRKGDLSQSKRVVTYFIVFLNFYRVFNVLFYFYYFKYFCVLTCLFLPVVLVVVHTRSCFYRNHGNNIQQGGTELTDQRERTMQETKLFHTKVSLRFGKLKNAKKE